MVHSVQIHQEHQEAVKLDCFLCDYHYLLAESCKMIDQDRGQVEGDCYFCR